VLLYVCDATVVNSANAAALNATLIGLGAQLVLMRACCNRRFQVVISPRVVQVPLAPRSYVSHLFLATQLATSYNCVLCAMFVIVLMTPIVCCRRYLYNNTLTGTVPTELGLLTALNYLCALRAVCCPV
jgi:hypothetical protein